MACMQVKPHNSPGAEEARNTDVFGQPIDQINPRINEQPNMAGGGMFVCGIINDDTVVLKHFFARWLTVEARVFRHRGQLYCF
jgi:hypothetical protein